MYSVEFFLKKLISVFLMPLPLCLGVIFIGLIFLWFTKKDKIGKILVTIGAILLFFMSTGIMTIMIVGPLDQLYPVYTLVENRPVKFVVVLSGGARYKDGIPLNTNSDHATLSRLMEGVRVYKCNPGSKIILTGRSISQRIPFSVVEACLLVGLGIPKEDIILDTESLDTAEEALNVKKITGNEPFVLVTSSLHMTRALKLFQKQGMGPILAPTDFVIVPSYLSVSDFIPNTGSLRSIDKTFHEYLGIFWAKICGQIE